MYSDDVDLEAQQPYSDSPEFDSLAEQVATGVFNINSGLVKLQSLLKAFNNNPKPTVQERAVEIADSTRQEFKTLSDPIRRLQSWQDPLPPQKFTQQKLSREFSTALSEFQELQRDLAEKQRLAIVKTKTHIAEVQAEEQDQDQDHEPAAAEQTLLQEELNQEEVDYQQRLIEERESEIQNIEHGISELNEIFTDLGTIVTEQGTIIDNIEANVYSYAQSTRDASTQLTKAARSQRNARGRAFCLLIILIIVLTVILLAMFLG